MLLRSLLCAALLAAGAPSIRAELPETVRAQLRAARIPEEALGLVARRVRDGALLVSHGADRSMQPASTLKLLTSLVALETLGPAYRGRTELRTRAEIVDGVLRGDLIVRGLADVDLDRAAFERMLQSLRIQGIRRIDGDLVLDRSMFQPPRGDIGTPPFDESPEFRYNVIPDALLLNTNLIELDLLSDEAGVRAALATPLDKVVVASQLKLVERRCEDWEDGWTTPAVSEDGDGIVRIVLQGEYPLNCAASTAIDVIDRVRLAERMFTALWTRLGGTFKGIARDGETPPETRVLAEHRSRALSELVRDINKRSDNPITRVVFLTLGALSPVGPGEPTARRAEREVRDWLTRRAIDSSGLVLENGSGLSREERLRPAMLAAVLAAARRSEWAPEFLASLPIVAVDGAMRSRLRGSAAAGSARIKTGTLRDVSAVAGYVNDAAGDACVVVAILNHELAVSRVARPILDSILEWVARAPPKEPEGSWP